MDAETYQLHLRAGRRYGREATCGQKVDYHSEFSANRAAEAMTAKRLDDKVLEAYPCAWCDGWHIGRAMSDQELRAAGATMELFGQHAPAELGVAGDGYIPGAWDEVRRAYLDGHISEEAYDVLHKQMALIRGMTEFPRE